MPPNIEQTIPGFIPDFAINVSRLTNIETERLVKFKATQI